jgi:hypothetical protein
LGETRSSPSAGFIDPWQPAAAQLLTKICCWIWAAPDGQVIAAASLPGRVALS